MGEGGYSTGKGLHVWVRGGIFNGKGYTCMGERGICNWKGFTCMGEGGIFNGKGFTCMGEGGYSMRKDSRMEGKDDNKFYISCGFSKADYFNNNHLFFLPLLSFLKS